MCMGKPISGRQNKEVDKSVEIKQLISKCLPKDVLPVPVTHSRKPVKFKKRYWITYVTIIICYEMVSCYRHYNM